MWLHRRSDEKIQRERERERERENSSTQTRRVSTIRTDEMKSDFEYLIRRMSRVNVTESEQM
jgi:hypothetical protein